MLNFFRLRVVAARERENIKWGVPSRAVQTCLKQLLRFKTLSHLFSTRSVGEACSQPSAGNLRAALGLELDDFAKLLQRDLGLRRLEQQALLAAPGPGAVLVVLRSPAAQSIRHSA